MAYTKTIWENSPSENTPLSAENLNNIENGIEDVDTRLTTAEGEIDNLQTGWIPANETYSYVSWNSTTKIGVVGTNQDTTGLLSVGMKVRFVQNSVVKYGFIVAITASQITLFMGTDYTLENSVITDAYYSMLKSPYGFPMGSDKWSLKATLPNGFTRETPVAGTVYTTGLSLLVPIGKWKIKGNGTLQVLSTYTTSIRMKAGVSTANNSYNNLENVTFAGYDLSSAGAQNLNSGATIEFSANLSSNTTYYYNVSTPSTGVSELVLKSNEFANTPTIIAICDYL